MNGIIVRIKFLKNNTEVDACLSPLLTLRENINNVIKMKFHHENYDYSSVFSKYDDTYLNVDEKVERLNLYNHVFLYVC